MIIMKKIIMILCFILISFIDIVSVSAVDVDNSSSIGTYNAENVVLGEPVYMTSDNFHNSSYSSQNNADEIEEILSSNLINDNSEDNPINDSGKYNFNINQANPRIISPIVIIDQPLRLADLNCLQESIDEVPKGSTLDLYNDMKNNGEENKIVNINKDMTIDCHGKTIDFGGRKNCYIEINAKNVILKNINFINGFNDKSDKGGALYIHDNTIVTLVNCNFSDNFARKSGGAVYSDYTLNIVNCHFHNNVANDEDGGAVYGTIVNIDSSTFDGNKADDNGGAVYAKNYVNINKDQDVNHDRNCYFINNHAGDNGGAIYCDGEVLVKNTQLNNNFAGSNDKGGAIWANMNIIINNSSYHMNFCGKSAHDEVYSKNGKIILDENSVKTASNYDNLEDVSLSKDVANFYLKNSNDMKNLFKFITKYNPSWNIINITLAPNTVFTVDYCTFDTKFQKYALRLTGNMVINGNPGSVIKGKINDGGGKKNDFMYLTPNSKLLLVNVSIEHFDQVFMTLGSIYASNTAFVQNKAYIPYSSDKNDGFQSFKKSHLWSGAVLHNRGNAYFDKCVFYGNYAESYYGDVLYAEEHALTVFDDCTFKDCDDTFIYAKGKSATIIYQDYNLNDDLKDCYFEPDASLSVISSKAYNETYVFNCSNVNELQKVLYKINSLTPNAQNIVINLKPGTYNIQSEWLSKKNYMRSMNWRDECYSPTTFSSGMYRTDSGISRYHYALDVGFIPVTINGNGATIKIVGGDDDDCNKFACIGYGGILNVVNVTFTKFNGVFADYGTLNAINCTFTDNVDSDKESNGGSIVFGAGSSNHFINCTFNKNTNHKSHSDIMNLKDSNIAFDGCNFDNFFKDRIILGKVVDNSVVDAPLLLKDKIDLDKSSVFHNNDKIICNKTTLNHGGIVLVKVNNKTNLTDTKISAVCDEVDPVNLVLNISKDCEIDLSKLGFEDNLIINGNGHNVKFIHQEEIKKPQSITLINITFSEYSHILFKSKGSCTFILCNFTGNTGKYLVDIDEGACTFINCTFTGNKNKNKLINNDEGSLSFINCTIKDNDGKIYNEKGTLFFYNCDIGPETLIHNYETANCEIISCIGGNNTKFEEKEGLATWKIALIMGGASLVVGVASYFVGVGCYNIGFSLGHTICGIVAAGICGAMIGAAGGYAADAIIAHYTHNHCYRYVLIAGMATLGIVTGLAGAFMTSSRIENRLLCEEAADLNDINYLHLKKGLYGKSFVKYDVALEAEFFIGDVSEIPEHIVNANLSRFGSFSYEPQQIISFEV